MKLDLLIHEDEELKNTSQNPPEKSPKDLMKEIAQEKAKIQKLLHDMELECAKTSFFEKRPNKSPTRTFGTLSEAYGGYPAQDRGLAEKIFQCLKDGKELIEQVGFDEAVKTFQLSLSHGEWRNIWQHFEAKDPISEDDFILWYLNEQQKRNAEAIFREFEQNEAGSLDEVSLENLVTACGAPHSEPTYVSILSKLKMRGHLAREMFVEWYTTVVLIHNASGQQERQMKPLAKKNFGIFDPFHVAERLKIMRAKLQAEKTLLPGPDTPPNEENEQLHHEESPERSIIDDTTNQQEITQLVSVRAAISFDVMDKDKTGQISRSSIPPLMHLLERFNAPYHPSNWQYPDSGALTKPAFVNWYINWIWPETTTLPLPKHSPRSATSHTPLLDRFLTEETKLPDPILPV